MISELNNVLVTSKEPRYLTVEDKYRHDHPEVIRTTQYFLDRAKQERDVFVNINKTLKKNRNLIVASKIATIWLEFSKFVPSFIAKAVSLSVDPEHQHHLIQIAYDELGARNKKFIHSILFLEALDKANIELIKTHSLSSIKKLLSSLNQRLEKIKTASGIIGLLLSLEIIAEENIETVFRALSIDEERERILSSSLFFKIHRADETEHIRHSVANFLKFSRSRTNIKDGERLFDVGITFWQNFWDEVAEIITYENA